MAKWIEYTGSINNLEDIIHHHGKSIAYKYHAAEVPLIKYICKDERVMRNILRTASHYLICQPHPYADEIKIWADTGCEVWVREPIDYAMTGDMYKEYVTDQPNWNIPNAEYRLTPFED